MNMVRKEEPTLVASETATVLSMIARAASDPACDLDKMERLMAMRKDMLGQQAEQDFNQAMNRAQSEMGRIRTNQENTQTHSKYADYAALDRALRPLYVKEGFALSFDTADAPEGLVRVLCHVSHSGGHTRTYRTDMPNDGKGAKGNDVMTKTHASGAAMTYGMRYLLKMIFNVAIGEDDNDGNEEAPRITEEQEAILRDLAASVGADMPKFLAYLKIDRLNHLRASSYKGALAGLEAKRAKR
jgi:hypothetical protein